MKPWTLPIALAALLGTTGAARADQCMLVDGGTAMRALQLLHDHPQVLTYCEPCNDRAPGDPSAAGWVSTERDRSGSYQVVVDRREIDLAYTYVQTGPDRFDNLGQLAGCMPAGVSTTLTIRPPLVLAPRPVVPEPPPRTTYVVSARPSVSFLALLGTCTATSAACTLGLFLLLRRRRLAMRPRALELLDRNRRS